MLELWGLVIVPSFPDSFLSWELGRGQLYLQLPVVHQLRLPRRAPGVYGDRPLHDGTV